jgi:hypothetical protein
LTEVDSSFLELDMNASNQATKGHIASTLNTNREMGEWRASIIQLGAMKLARYRESRGYASSMGGNSYIRAKTRLVTERAAVAQIHASVGRAG